VSVPESRADDDDDDDDDEIVVVGPLLKTFSLTIEAHYREREVGF
jgi:hypothetical protein